MMEMTLGFSARRSVKQDVRVVKGHLTGRGEFPYVVALQMDHKHECFDWSETSKCTGSILTEYWILTAGHCCAPVDQLQLIEYKAGEIDVNPGQFKNICRIVLHPDYFETHDGDSELMYDDLCLLKAKEKISLNKYVKNVCISSSGEMTGRCVTVGFGRTTDPGYNGNNVMMHFETLEFETRRPFAYPQVADTLELTAKGSYPSLGDSGGPLMCNGKQVGMCSAGGIANGTANLVYVIVGRYKQWIEETIQEDIFDKCEKEVPKYTTTATTETKYTKSTIGISGGDLVNKYNTFYLYILCLHIFQLI
ncbi:hypothetical protein L9F63_027042 [Diploptera punctata]|uniref:Peptidase S1 domain-containing protein n=1 Tax=Diploptera punctata TaxID=6984 RepID=A0AAD8AFX0_DIPPU|nr:hypothetical protein L9F63_027042 [Diploptera punctata]